MKYRCLWWAEHVAALLEQAARMEFMGKPLEKGPPGRLKADMGG